MDSLLAGTLDPPLEGFIVPVMMSSAAVPVKNIPGIAKAIPGSGEKPFAFPPESLFAFRPGVLFAITPESFSRSPRNPVRLALESALSLRRKKRKRWMRQRISNAPASAPNQEWALDFVTDALASGRHVRVLTVVDVFTRECLALETDTSLGSLRVIRVLEQIITERGAPQRLRQDNGPEFTSRAYLVWALDRRIELLHIRPGKPIENAYIESFNGRLREECLYLCWFRNLFDARRQILAWREHYNTRRPHSSLGYLTPEQFAALPRAAGQSSAELGQGASPFPRPPSPSHTGGHCFDPSYRMLG